jgi:hypothetical protein
MSEDVAPYVVGAPARLAPVVLMQCPVAGFQYGDGESCWHRMRRGDSLTLRREPGNRNDPRAVRIEWKGIVLGFVPREANYALSQMLDRGEAVAARIDAMQVSHDPWKRVMVEVDWHPLPGPLPRERENANPLPREREESVVLGTFVQGAVPAKIEVAWAPGSVDARARMLGMQVLEQCHIDIAGRLALPALGFVREGCRVVRVWDMLEISISDDGRWLSARSLDPYPISRVRLSADLRAPIGAASWSGAFDARVGRMLAIYGGNSNTMPGPRGMWMLRCLQRTFRPYVDFSGLRRAILDFLAPDRLTRSLANRIFGTTASDEDFNWCGRRCPALALAAIEHPRLLPFVRVIRHQKKVPCGDPIKALHSFLIARGLEAGALKRLERWGFEPFEEMEDVIGYANLLFRLDVADAPPEFFTRVAGYVAHWSGKGASAFGREVPDWFMRALLRQVERLEEDMDEATLCEQVEAALPWIASTPRAPDSNQQKAGWPWIFERARLFAISHEEGEWPVPRADFTIGDYQIVAIRTRAQLEQEGIAMKNCLANYAERCRLGLWAVYSIRETGVGDKRLATFAVEKEIARGKIRWELHQVAGTMNSPVSPDIDAITEIAVASLNMG